MPFTLPVKGMSPADLDGLSKTVLKRVYFRLKEKEDRKSVNFIDFSLLLHKHMTIDVCPHVFLRKFKVGGRGYI